jgi:hypothetical protein
MSGKEARFSSKKLVKAVKCCYCLAVTDVVINHLLNKNVIRLNAGQIEVKCQS